MVLVTVTGIVPLFIKPLKSTTAGNGIDAELNGLGCVNRGPRVKTRKPAPTGILVAAVGKPTKPSC